MKRWKLFARFLRDEEGSALVEMAIYASIMILTIPAMVSYAERIAAEQRLSMGMRAGLQYMMANQSTSNDTLADIMETAGAQSSYPITADASVGCECAYGQGVTCGTTCSGGAAPAKYLTVTASTTITNFWGQSTQTVTRQTTVRVQ